ncbi:MAG: PEP-CTERM sorting domain-containing protein, partial [Mariprofundaceae bacterium]|nr:PEP-CTERM sorting domain-containing protein [Mariprofundaceae bacterium]
GTGTAWFTSTVGPTSSGFIVNGAPGLMAAPDPLGGPLGVPGVPEPETWALLLAMMAFTTLWMRRRQDDEPLETSIAA